MKYNGKLITISYVIISALFITACGQIQKEYKYKLVKVNLNNEFIGIVSPPKGGTLKNFTIFTTDTKKKVVLFAGELSQNRIIALPKGKYEFHAVGIQNKTFDLSDDCKIVSDGKTFTQLPLVRPPAISFRREKSGEDITGNLMVSTSYYLTILDLDNLNEPVDSYKVNITGSGGYNESIPLGNDKENNRIISENVYRPTKTGKYKVNVLVDGISGRITPFEFTVDPLPPPIPISLTINNTWGGIPLQYANIIVYRFPASTSPPRLERIMSRSDDGTETLSFNRFNYSNSQYIIRSGESERFNIGNNGKIELPRTIYNGDYIILIAMGVKTEDAVYTNTFSVTSAIYNRRETTIPWQDIPSKGRNFVVNVPVDRYSQESWGKIDNFSPSFYYRLGNPATIPSQTVLAGNGFTQANVVDFRRETDDSIMCFVDMSKISAVSHFNYLLSVTDANMGTFIMNNTSDEISRVSQPLRRQE